MIKTKLALSLLFALGLVGCQESTAPYIVYGAIDPLTRASGGMRSWFMGDGTFDAAFVIDREEAEGVDSSLISSRAAFNKGGWPAQVQSVTVNGEALVWIPNESKNAEPNTYAGHRTGIEHTDSLPISVTNFEGENLSFDAPVAPEFGLFPFDTVDGTTDLIIKYRNTVEGDSVGVNLQALDNSLGGQYAYFADNGTIVVPQRSLPIVANTTMLLLELERVRLDSLQTPRGKRIAIASRQSVETILYVRH